eukprot:GGOE01032589.1.p1 GENE.GGOE01032589.1~~GGOE01032589.1.p1  ORF type:complete len:226 (+),score=1.03 GGOE01032589.1:1003-1680(+)
MLAAVTPPLHQSHHSSFAFTLLAQQLTAAGSSCHRQSPAERGSGCDPPGGWRAMPVLQSQAEKEALWGSQWRACLITIAALFEPGLRHPPGQRLSERCSEGVPTRDLASQKRGGERKQRAMDGMRADFQSVTTEGTETPSLRVSDPRSKSQGWCMTRLTCWAPEPERWVVVGCLYDLVRCERPVVAQSHACAVEGKPAQWVSLALGCLLEQASCSPGVGFPLAGG